MKGLTGKRKRDSLVKWMDVVKNIKLKKPYGYICLYWEPCGFCRAGKGNGGCSKCALRTNDVCYGNQSKRMTSAFLALLYANKGMWGCALDQAKRVLAAIEATPTEEGED